MKKIVGIILVVSHITTFNYSQSALDIIDSLNTKILDNCVSFSYDVKVENLDDSIFKMLDSGNVTINHTLGKYDDFLFVSYYKRDTFCFVQDTLIRTVGPRIFKDHNLDVLNTRLGTTKMYFRCYTPSFRNDTKIINPDRWHDIVLDSIDSYFYYITLKDTMKVFGRVDEVISQVVIYKKSFYISKYFYKHMGSNGNITKNLFTFSNWTTSIKTCDSVYDVFERLRQRSVDPDYLARYPTRKMKLDHNKTLDLDSLSFSDSHDVSYYIADIHTRYVVVYFWFQGCYHCKYVGPIIQKYHNTKGRDDITYLGMDTMSKNKESLIISVKRSKYDFPNFRYNGGVPGFAVNVAPLVVIYDRVQKKIVEQIEGGDADYETRFSKIIDSLPIELSKY